MAQNVPPIQITVNFKNVRSYPKNVGQKMLIYAKFFFQKILKDGGRPAAHLQVHRWENFPKIERKTFSKIENAHP